MKRLAAGALGVGLAIMTPEALVQTPEYCAPVYDEMTGRGETATSLTTAIERFEDLGVDVYVQIFDHRQAGDPNMSVDEVRVLFADNLAQECQHNPERISLLISEQQDTVQFDLVYAGAVNEFVSGVEAAGAEQLLIDQLTDPAGDYQQDAATVLSYINEAVSEQAVAVALQKEAKDETNFPIIPLAGGISLVLLAGGVAARVLRGRQINSLMKSSMAEDSATDLRALEVITETGDETWKGETTVLERLVGELKDAQSTQFQAKEQLKADREDLSVIWPSKQRIVNAAESLANTINQTKTLTQTVSEEMERVIRLREELETNASHFATELSNAQAALDVRQKEGWELGGLVEQLATFSTTQQKIMELRAGQYTHQPAELIATHLPDLQKLHLTLATLPQQRSEGDSESQGQASLIDMYQEDSRTMLESYAVARADYAESCLVGFENFEETVNGLTARLVEIQGQGADYRGVLSAEAVEKTEQLNEAFSQAASELEDLETRLGQRFEQLEVLRARLPNFVNTLEIKLQGIWDQVFDQRAQDFSPETRIRIDDYRKVFEAFVNQELKIDQPNYLDLETKSADLAVQISMLAEEVAEEHGKTLAARSRLDQYNQLMPHQIESLQDLCNNRDVSDTTQQQASRLQFVPLDSTLSHDSLMGAVEISKDLERRVSELKAAAEHDIEQAEERREADRRRQESDRQARLQEEALRERLYEEGRERARRPSSSLGRAAASMAERITSGRSGSGESRRTPASREQSKPSHRTSNPKPVSGSSRRSGGTGSKPAGGSSRRSASPKKSANVSRKKGK